MRKNISIVIAEDDDGHAFLIKRSLQKAGIINPIIHFKNGEEVLDYFLSDDSPYKKNKEESYIILLDIKMPRADGIEVLGKLKTNPSTKRIPVIMITTTDNPREIETCHALGCSSYIVKPIDYQAFIKIVAQLGYKMKIIEAPTDLQSNDQQSDAK